MVSIFHVIFVAVLILTLEKIKIENARTSTTWVKNPIGSEIVCATCIDIQFNHSRKEILKGPSKYTIPN